MTEKCMSAFYMIRAMTSVYKAGILVSNWDNLGDWKDRFDNFEALEDDI